MTTSHTPNATPIRLTRSRTLRLARLAAIGVVALAVVPAAIAQNTGQVNGKTVVLNPPTPPNTGSTGFSPVTSIMTGILIAALAVGMNFIPSKRGHQD